MNFKAQISEESSPKKYCTWQEIELLVEELVHTIQTSGKKYDLILAITNGGIIPARLIARELDINHIQFIPIRDKQLHIEEMLPLLKGTKYLVIDDIYDTGDTYNKVYNVINEFDYDFAFLMTRYKHSNATLVAKVLNHEKWIVFPWEKKRY
ncbi:MAG TPA: phosphoribosyltransferase family protein [Nitrososphaeraceae archaeon]|nr:phosphoribosyltransferase family protein [Nitrososphaeraceae archaeon]